MQSAIARWPRIPSTLRTTLTRSASLSPAVPSCGCSANRALLKAKNWSGERSATHAAAFAARSEYFVPCERFARIATGWMSTVAAPDSTRPSM